MRYLKILILLLSFNYCYAQIGPDKLVLLLKQADFGAVYEAKTKINYADKEMIGKLIELLKDTAFAKLKNTGDLIYPGADKYYGHGWIVNYDIDWVSVRAAWILEEITFQDFGYRDLTITENKLQNLHQQNYTSYLQSGSHPINFKDKTPRQQLIIYRLMLADSVSKWWDKNKRNWTRFKGLKDALSSSNEQRQQDALHYLRFDDTECDGLTIDSYTNELKPLVDKISTGKNEQATQAKYLLNDTKNQWLKIKLHKRGS